MTPRSDFSARNFAGPNTLNPYFDDCRLPPADRTLPAQARMTVGGVVRDGGSKDGGAAAYQYFLSTQASPNHPLQDAISVSTLPGPTMLMTCGDATTHAQGIAPEDAMHFVFRDQPKSALDQMEAAGWVCPAGLLCAAQQGLRAALDRLPGAVVGVAQSIVTLDVRTGCIQLASVGDTQALIFRPARWWRRARVRALTTLPVPGADTRRLASALGQSAKRALLMDLASAQLGRGDLLILGTDGGLPAPDAPELRLTLQAYERERRAGLPDLARLAGVLMQRAERMGNYADDQSLVLLIRL